MAGGTKRKPQELPGMQVPRLGWALRTSKFLATLERSISKRNPLDFKDGAGRPFPPGHGTDSPTRFTYK